MTYRAKYIPPNPKEASVIGTPGKGNKVNPANWTGDRLINRDKYYAYLKHKAQANYRGEAYFLTWEDWQQIWPNDLWLKRGRKIDDLCLTRPTFAGPWSMQTVEVTSRRQHFLYKKAYYKNVRS